MPNTIIKTKINVPALRRSLVSRKRLMNLLSEGIRQRRQLTVVSAPAGFGKTTLVSEWIASNEIPAAWISLDEGDDNPSRFLTYLIAALQTLFSGLGDDILSALRSSQALPIETHLTSLLNELAASEEDFVLVLDDYQMVDSKAVDELLHFFIEHMPPQMHVIITTREDPALPLARLRVRNQLTEIRASDLRFTDGEAADFLNQVMGLHLSAKEVSTLEARTEGWVAGLQLAALSMQGHRDTAEFIRSFSGAHQFVLDYLLEEVLQKQPEDLQGFLLHTSILNRLSGSVCDALWRDEKTSGQERLEYLEHANLFVIPLDNERRWHRYHHLFRDLLRQRLAQKLTKAEIAQTHIRASEWLEQNGDIAEAFQHAISAEDLDRGARLAEFAWQGMDESFQAGTWLGWVKQLPASVIRVRPVLCTQRGWAFMDAGNVADSESSLRDAEQCLKLPSHEMVVVEKNQFRVLPARIAIARAYNAQAQNHFSDAVKYAGMAIELAPNEDDFLRTQASSILSGTHWASGDLDAANKFMSDWIDAAKKAGNLFFAVAAAFGKADILTMQGRLREVMQVYQQVLEFASANSAENFTSHHHLGLGMLHHELGNDELAAQHVQKAFELGKQSTIVDWAYRKSLAQAQWKESEGDLNGALEFLDEAKRFYVRTPIPDLRPVDALKARMYLKQGDLQQAQAWAWSSGLSLRDKAEYLHEFELLTLVNLTLTGQPDEQQLADAFSLLERLYQKATEQNRPRSQIEILMMQALVFKSKQHSSKSLEALKQALQLAEPEGYLRLFLDEGAPIIALLSEAANKNISPAYVRKILAHQTSASEPARISASNSLIEPLSERELEVLHLIAQGLSNQEITQKLVVALSTVKGHNLRIFAKLQAKSRTEAVARARELGLL